MYLENIAVTGRGALKYHKLHRVTLRTGVEIILGENWTIKMNFNWMISYQFYDQGLSYLLLRHQIILFYTRSLVYQVEDCTKIDVTNKIYLVRRVYHTRLGVKTNFKLNSRTTDLIVI